MIVNFEQGRSMSRLTYLVLEELFHRTRHVGPDFSVVHFLKISRRHIDRVPSHCRDLDARLACSFAPRHEDTPVWDVWGVVDHDFEAEIVRF